MSDQRYRVVIGLSVSKEEMPGFSDNGIVYHNMKYDQMVKVQELFAKHSSSILVGIAGLVDDLVAVGVDEAVSRVGPDNMATREMQPNPIQRDPGAIR